jgi:hypothetical protein
VAEIPFDYRLADPEAGSVLRRYLDGDRLASMPRAGRKRQIVLEYIVTIFEPGRRYAEAEVDAALRAIHDDVPALRRYLVEAGLLDRAAGEYWRSGGWVDGS